MQQKKRERTQTEIIQAAKEIIYEKGHEAITVRYLAEITGYSHTNLYYYYKDLNAFFWSLRLEMIEEMVAELTSVSFPNDDPVKEILNVFFRYTDYFFRNPNVFRFFYFYPFVPPKGDDRYQNLEERFGGMWQNSFFRLVQEGVIQANEIEIVAKTIIYSLQGMIMLSFSSNGSAKQEVLKKELVKLVSYLFKKNNENI